MKSDRTCALPGCDLPARSNHPTSTCCDKHNRKLTDILVRERKKNDPEFLRHERARNAESKARARARKAAAGDKFDKAPKMLTCACGKCGKTWMDKRNNRKYALDCPTYKQMRRELCKGLAAKSRDNKKPRDVNGLQYRDYSKVAEAKGLPVQPFKVSKVQRTLNQRIDLIVRAANTFADYNPRNPERYIAMLDGTQVSAPFYPRWQAND